MESNSDGQELHQWQDIPGEKVPMLFDISFNLLTIHYLSLLCLLMFLAVILCCEERHLLGCDAMWLL
jgi:hypothetical protein